LWNVVSDEAAGDGLQRGSVSSNSLTYHPFQAKLHREIDILKRIRHPNCIQLHEGKMSLSCPSSLWIEDTAQDFEKAIGALIISAEILHWTAAVGLSAYSLPLLAVFETAKYIQIVTEKVTGGELFDRIVTKDHFNETEAAKVFVQIIEAIDYLHSIGVVHRDLKPENVLYSSPDDDSTIKIAGEGASPLPAAKVHYAHLIFDAILLYHTTVVLDCRAFHPDSRQRARASQTSGLASLCRTTATPCERCAGRRSMSPQRCS
jgi:serine/threonine protein kinase